MRQLAKYFRRSPSELGEDEVRAFLAHLIQVRKVAPATHIVYVAAFKDGGECLSTSAVARERKIGT